MKLTKNEHLSHFKTSRINTNGLNSIDFVFKDRAYLIDFNDDRVEKGYGYCVKSIDGNLVEWILLQWLTLYFGESADDPYSVRNNTYFHKRGYQDFDRAFFLKFIGKVSKFPFSSYTKWRNELLRKSLAMYCVGVRLSVDYMPITVGYFANSIEGLSNAYWNDRSNYKTLGSNPYKKLINARFMRLKKSKKHGEEVKRWLKYIEQEIDVITEIRNVYCGHSLMHSKKERKKLISVMNNWSVKHGWDRKNAKRKAYRTSITEKTLGGVHSGAVFKLSMNTNRILFFYYFNLIRDLPFTEHDFTLFGVKLDKDPLVIEHPDRIA
ncbi:TPA: hypothetical protein MAM68_002063 [Klebsiella pneumoniae]|nr:hypothetical protein [Klebsiella pneumoniae]